MNGYQRRKMFHDFVLSAAVFIGIDHEGEKMKKQRKLCSVDGCDQLTEYPSCQWCMRHHGQIRWRGKTYRTYYDGNEIIKYKDYAEMKIRRRNGDCYFSKIDLVDIPKLENISWSITAHGYVTNFHVGFLHDFLLEITPHRNLMADHINRDKLDNRRCNLRVVNRAGNTRNHCIRKDNLSGYTGVRYVEKRRHHWSAYICVNKVEICGGWYATKEEAIARRKELEIKYWGENI